MRQIDLTKEEIARRESLARKTREMILSQLKNASEDESSLQTVYNDFYLQISFSSLHPLMVICLIRNLNEGAPARQLEAINEMNLKSVLGCHVINHHFGFYHYRSTHWLDTELQPARFFEILDRCYENASRGYASLF